MLIEKEKMKKIFKSPTVTNINLSKSIDSSNKKESFLIKNEHNKAFELNKGMKVFLDLRNYPEKMKIFNLLKKFGVIVDDFLSKDIDWLISDRNTSTVENCPKTPSLLKPKGKLVFFCS